MKEVRLEDITLNITDGKHGDCESEENSGYFFISCKDVLNGSIHYENARQITEQAYRETHKRTKLELDDILVTNSGTIGRMALIKDIPETYKTTFQKSVAIVKPNKNLIRPTYLYYCLLNCVNQFINQSNGSAQKNLLLVTMRNFKLNIEEDFSIQNKLSDILSTYDALIENNQKQIKLLEEAAQRLYKEWFVDLRFPGYEDVEIVDDIPNGWRNAQLGDVIDINKENISKNYSYDHIDYIDISSVRTGAILNTNFYALADAPGRAKRCIHDGDVIWGMVRPNLKSYALIMNPTNTMIASTGFAVLTPKNIPFTFLYCIVTQEAFVGYLINCTNGAAYPAVKPIYFQQSPVLIPTDELLNQFHLITEPLFRKIDTLHMQVNILTEARDRLLPKLMNGLIEI